MFAELLEKAQKRVQSMVAEAAGVSIDDAESEGESDNASIHHPFQLPITYLPESSKQFLSPIVSQDLELVPVPVPTHSPNAMYHVLFQPSHPWAESTIHDWNRQFSTDIDYLTDTQKILQEIHLTNMTVDYSGVMEVWKDTKQEKYFLEKYNYVEWDILKSLNKSSGFLQILSVVNMISPALSLVAPILFFIIPFVLLRIRGIPITFPIYIQTLKEIAKHHFIGKALTNFSSLSLEKVVYIFLGAGFYLYQVYQNVILCMRFYKNIMKIYEQMRTMRNYLGQTTEKMRRFVSLARSKKTYEGFCKTVDQHYLVLEQYYGELTGIPDTSTFISKIGSVGYLLKCYYEMNSNLAYETSIRYSFGFEGFLDNLWGVARNIQDGNISFAKYDVSKSCKFVKQYYPIYAGTSHVKNTCSLDKKLIITGPNASGKTTLLKTTSINVIFSQQVGCGFYESCTINPYTHIHSYLNIPDTSERDSLFQAESRRCKEIIDVIRETPPESRHYCIFDELYSGTNPKEATKSAYAFMKYLTKYDNVDFILTTHYTSICSKLKKCDKIVNYKMDASMDTLGVLKYTYKMKKGISKIQGAIQILESMDYPKEILDCIRQTKSE